MQLPIPLLNATDVCSSQSVGKWCHRTDPWHFQTSKQTTKSEATTKCQMQGPTLREINAKLTRRDPSPLCVNCLCTSHFSLWVFVTRFCRSPWKCVRRGHDWNTGSVSFQDFVFKCNRCLSDFQPSVITNRNIGLWVWSGEKGRGSPAWLGHSTKWWKR